MSCSGPIQDLIGSEAICDDRCHSDYLRGASTRSRLGKPWRHFACDKGARTVSKVTKALAATQLDNEVPICGDHASLRWRPEFASRWGLALETGV